MAGWIGVDLDGTLAHYGGSVTGIGEPIPAMAERVREWLARGIEVRIFTARVAVTGHHVAASGLLDDSVFADAQREMIQDWTEQHFGVRLPVTATKDYGSVRNLTELYGLTLL